MNHSTHLLTSPSSIRRERTERRRERRITGKRKRWLSVKIQRKLIVYLFSVCVVHGILIDFLRERNSTKILKNLTYQKWKQTKKNRLSIFRTRVFLNSNHTSVVIDRIGISYFIFLSIPENNKACCALAFPWAAAFSYQACAFTGQGKPRRKGRGATAFHKCVNMKEGKALRWWVTESWSKITFTFWLVKYFVIEKAKINRKQNGKNQIRIGWGKIKNKV
jgi:hypothetical protein